MENSNKRVKLLQGDNMESFKKLPDNSIDSVVTDGPYGLSFMNKKWDYDVPSVDFWKEVYRVLKPGGHILSFGGTRTYHRMTVNIEDAGFEIRDQIMWLYGSGFPKSHNIGKAVDKFGGNNLLSSEIGTQLKEARTKRGLTLKAADELFCGGTSNYNWLEGRSDGQRIPNGELFDKIVAEWPELKDIRDKVLETEREILGTEITNKTVMSKIGEENEAGEYVRTKGQSQWEGWGTALKPANEPICVARKPLSEKSVAENVLKWGTGGINIDGCRVGSESINTIHNPKITGKMGQSHGEQKGFIEGENTSHEGRFPANIILECLCDEVIKGEKGGLKEFHRKDSGSIYGGGKGLGDTKGSYISGDKGDIHTNPMCPCYLMDEQSGVSKSTPIKESIRKENILNKETNSKKDIYAAGALKSGSNHSDKGGASRFFYQAKVSKAERNMGLEGFEIEILTPTIKLLLKTDYNNKNFIWEKEDLKTKLVDTGKSHQKDIEEYITTDDNKWNTEWFGNIITDQFLTDAKSIIETKTNSTTIYQTLNLLIQKNIKKNIQELLGETASDINFVEDVEKKNTKVIITSQKKDGLNQNVNPVLLEEVWIINIKENKCSHPTLKPIQLMSYLCRLVTPPNGIVLDPFMGSGSTGIAAQLEGFKFVGMEMDPDYFKIASARIENFEKYRKFIK
jgi:DNA modification methylase